MTDGIDPSSGLYDGPVLVIDPGVHTGTITAIDIDADWLTLVTGSEDKSVRIWNARNGHLLRTIWMPQGPRDLGQVRSVAISPDGSLIGIGGCFGDGVCDRILLYRSRSGTFAGQIDALPDGVYGLAFSPDGKRLAATLFKGGMRLFESVAEATWKEINSDADYTGASYKIAFAADGRFSTTCNDGCIRLYDRDGTKIKQCMVGGKPAGLAFSHAGDRIALTFWEQDRAEILDGRTLELVCPIGYFGEMAFPSAVDWSPDDTEVRVGIYDPPGQQPLIGIGGPSPSDFPLKGGDGHHPYVGLRTSPGGECLSATLDGFLALDRPDWTPKWKIRPKQIEWRGQCKSLGISHDGTAVDFYYLYGRLPPVAARFDATTCEVLFPEVEDLATKQPRPGLYDGRRVPRGDHERVLCVVDHPDGIRAVCGGNWSLAAFEGNRILWGLIGPSVWAVNISGNGEIVVAAKSDGTLRWHRMDNGVELLAFFPLLDGGDWVAWTPEGIYAATPGANRVLHWHVNHGWNAATESISIEAVPGTRRPEVIPHILRQMSTGAAIGVAELASVKTGIRRVTRAEVGQNDRLHVLTIGISKHRDDCLDLDYADKDAFDVARALSVSQKSLYSKVITHEPLTNAKATKAAILDGLAQVAAEMAAGEGDDLAIILIAGHGEVRGGALYLYPYDVDVTSTLGRFKTTALSIIELHGAVADIACHGKILLLIDTCYSGGAVDPLERSLRAFTVSSNISVIASATAYEESQESDEWENGVLTKAFLDSMRNADYDRDGRIRVSDIASYLADHIPTLTSGAQRPEVEINFIGKVLAALG